MKNPKNIIDNLAPSDAISILKTLAADDEQLAQRIAEIALTQFSVVDPEEIAADLYDELEALAVEELWDRSGSSRHGYTEPGEAADQMIEELLTPFLAEMKKYQQLGLSVQARQLCMGLVAGLDLFRRESTTQFKEWAPDAPSIFIEAVVDAWKEGAPSQEDQAALRVFIKEELGPSGMRLTI